MSISIIPRTIDHVVLPVVDVNVARERYEALGFCVAPDGLHPFGTENCCVFFEDGTFLEPLGIAHRETCEAAALKGNTFVSNDQTYRFRRGQEGFSHLVVKSEDAKADSALFKKNGLSGGRNVRFSRRFKTPDGKAGKAAFHLAFASDGRAPDAHFFACEVVQAPKVDRTSLMKHKNGAASLSEVVLSEPNPSDFQYFLQTFLNQREMDNNSFGIEFDTQNTKVTVLSPDGMKAFYDLTTEENERGLQFSVFVVGVKVLEKTVDLLRANNVAHRAMGNKVVVAPAPGQGTTIAFEEIGK